MFSVFSNLFYLALKHQFTGSPIWGHILLSMLSLSVEAVLCSLFSFFNNDFAQDLTTVLCYLPTILQGRDSLGSFPSLTDLELPLLLSPQSGEEVASYFLGSAFCLSLLLAGHSFLSSFDLLLLCAIWIVSLWALLSGELCTGKDWECCRFRRSPFRPILLAVNWSGTVLSQLHTLSCFAWGVAGEVCLQVKRHPLPLLHLLLQLLMSHRSQLFAHPHRFQRPWATLPIGLLEFLQRGFSSSVLVAFFICFYEGIGRASKTMPLSYILNFSPFAYTH